MAPFLSNLAQNVLSFKGNKFRLNHAGMCAVKSHFLRLDRWCKHPDRLIKTTWIQNQEQVVLHYILTLSVLTLLCTQGCLFSLACFGCSAEAKKVTPLNRLFQQQIISSFIFIIHNHIIQLLNLNLKTQVHYCRKCFHAYFGFNQGLYHCPSPKKVLADWQAFEFDLPCLRKLGGKNHWYLVKETSRNRVMSLGSFSMHTFVLYCI